MQTQTIPFLKIFSHAQHDHLKASKEHDISSAIDQARCLIQNQTEYALSFLYRHTILKKQNTETKKIYVAMHASWFKNRTQPVQADKKA